MQVAQKLYEGIPLDDPATPIALITYMRTDSKRISDTAIKQTRSFINKNFDNRLSQVFSFFLLIFFTPL